MITERVRKSHETLYDKILNHICQSVKSFFLNNFQGLFKLRIRRIRWRKGYDDVRFDADTVDFTAIGRAILGDGHLDGRLLEQKLYFL